ncbi:MBL fold metallo-hydrolase [Sutcliffiella horikoshii]|uniref:MBL fold metallo-hydrolase n=1 Tax=Sutcliffiella horikoshii TaxID=79883 RepID=A0AA95B6T1_9BACI|nr:MBL fold metallo-hydrolase [Sutcliffiella horikoshii]TYS58527.1 MBL fold metallo-hydrolase [Sutcliffiella horikoshii]
MLNKVTQAVYYLSNDDSKERPTLGLVCGDKFSLVIDSGNSVQHAQDFLKEIEALNVPPVEYLVVTHGHWDHILGMTEFGATIIVNSLTNQLLEEWQNYSFDDDSLHQYVESNKMSFKCMEIIKNEIPFRDSFRLNSADIIFEKSLTIDLGNKVCVLETIIGTHSDDSTILYVPDDKVLFLGDSVYGTTTNSLFHYNQSQLLPMIEEIQKYDATSFILGHESRCDAEEMNLYWKELISTSKATDSTSIDRAIECFERENNRTPNSNEHFFLKAFVNDHIIRSQQN